MHVQHLQHMLIWQLSTGQHPSCTHAGDMDEHAVEVVKSLLRWGSLRNNFHLAWHEFRDLAAPGDWALLQRLGSRAAIICAPNDHWFPRKHYDDMVANVAGLQVGG